MAFESCVISWTTCAVSLLFPSGFLWRRTREKCLFGACKPVSTIASSALWGKTLYRSVHSLRHVFTFVFSVWVFLFFLNMVCTSCDPFVKWPVSENRKLAWVIEMRVRLMLTAKALRSYHVPRGPDARARSDDVMRVACIWAKCLRPACLWTECNESHEMLLNCSFLCAWERTPVPTCSHVDKRKQRLCLTKPHICIVCFYLSTLTHVFPENLLFPDVKEVHIFPTCVRSFPSLSSDLSHMSRICLGE